MLNGESPFDMYVVRLFLSLASVERIKPVVIPLLVPTSSCHRFNKFFKSPAGLSLAPIHLHHL